MWTNIDGTRIFARTWPSASSGAPVVLVHGIAVSSRYMVPTAERLARDFPVYALDLPGFGQSDKPKRILSVEELATSLGEWLIANEVRDAILVGNSNGCQVIVDLVARRPDSCSALVLDSPTVDAAHRAVLPELALLCLDAPLERWSLIPINVVDYWRAGFRRSIGTLRSAIADRIEDKLPRIRQPVMIVRGARDPIVSDAWVRYLASCRAGTSVVTIPNAPHAANFSAPDAFASIVAEFARSTS